MKSIGMFIVFLFVVGLVRGCQAANAVQPTDHFLFIGDAYAVTVAVITIVIVIASCWWVGDWVDDE